MWTGRVVSFLRPIVGGPAAGSLSSRGGFREGDEHRGLKSRGKTVEGVRVGLWQGCHGREKWEKGHCANREFKRKLVLLEKVQGRMLYCVFLVKQKESPEGEINHGLSGEGNADPEEEEVTMISNGRATSEIPRSQGSGSSCKT